jgi:NAD(P)-dependent dehydrogenase (short-subunit alcohol dehydrogenase family)
VGRFEGKVAIVTGAASGIGEATARRLASEGAAVVVADLNEAGAERVAAAIEADAGRAVAQPVDVGDEAQVAAMVERAVAEWGRLDILHNNAADTSREAQQRDAVVAETDLDFFLHAVRVDLVGVVLGCKHAIPRLLENGSGAIVNTSSGAASGSFPDGMTAYSASKAAVESVTRSVAVQYGKRGIRCNGIAPGVTLSPAVLAGITPEVLSVIEHSVEAPGLSTPEQQAAVVAFLASDDAAFVNGHTIPTGAGSEAISTANALLRYAAAAGVLETFRYGQGSDREER